MLKAKTDCPAGRLEMILSRSDGEFTLPGARRTAEAVLQGFAERVIRVGTDLVLIEGHPKVIERIFGMTLAKACSPGETSLRDRINDSAARISRFKTLNRKALTAPDPNWPSKHKTEIQGLIKAYDSTYSPNCSAIDEALDVLKDLDAEIKNCNP